MEKLKLAYSSWIPFSGFYAINLFGWVIRRNKYKGEELFWVDYNHELTHTLQAEDFIPNKNNKGWRRILGYILFYIVYLIEWSIKGLFSIFTLGKIKAYRSISFEQVAYMNQEDSQYNKTRKRGDWIPYIFTIKI